MNFSPELATVTHGIELAVAPVFLLTAVPGMIAAAAERLARTIDRTLQLENKLEPGGVEASRAARRHAELGELRKRGWLSQWPHCLFHAVGLARRQPHHAALPWPDHRAAHPVNRIGLFPLRWHLLFAGTAVLPRRNLPRHAAAAVCDTDGTIASACASSEGLNQKYPKPLGSPSAKALRTLRPEVRAQIHTQIRTALL